MAKSNFLQLLKMPARPIQQPSPPNTAPSVQHGPTLDEHAQNSGLLESGIPETGIPKSDVSKSWPAAVVGNKLRYVREAERVQDGHSLGEQLVLTTLWNEAGSVKGQDYRRIRIGYRTLSSMCGLTVNNCKANLKALQAKLAIESETGYSNALATTYRVYSFTEILGRRRSAGLTHVIRNRGVMFVHPQTGIPLSGTPVLEKGIPETGTGGIPVSDKKGIPETGTLLRNKKEELQEASSSLLEVATAIRKIAPGADDDFVSTFVQKCRTAAVDVTAEEIAYFVRVKGDQARNSRRVASLTGFLLEAVPKCLAGTLLSNYRDAKHQEREREIAAWRAILADPATDDEYSQMARDELARLE